MLNRSFSDATDGRTVALKMRGLDAREARSMIALMIAEGRKIQTLARQVPVLSDLVHAKRADIREAIALTRAAA